MRVDWPQVTLALRGAGHTRWPGGRADPGKMWARWVFDHDLWVVDAGRGWVHMRDGWHELTPGRALWLRPGWEYWTEQDPAEPLGVYFCHFDLTDQAGAVIPPDGFWLPPEDLGETDLGFAAGVLSRAVAAAKGEPFGGNSFPRLKRDQVTGLLRGLLIELDEQSASRGQVTGTDPAEIERIQALAHRLAHDPAAAPSVSAMASELNLSPRHFTRLFQRVCDRTPKQFLLRWRTKHAQRLLMETELSVGEIAGRLGYRDIYFFSRQFREQVGHSPRQFRGAFKPGANG